MLAAQVEPVHSLVEKGLIAEAVLEIGMGDYYAVLKGDLAEKIRGVPAGSGIEVRGTLVQRQWKTRREDKPRERLVLVATTMEIQAKPEGKDRLVDA